MDGELVRAAFSTPSRYVGAQPWGELDWFIGPYLLAEGAYGHFFPGTAITDSGPGLAMNYLLVSTTFTYDSEGSHRATNDDGLDHSSDIRFRPTPQR
jgi:hypothetical protein